MDLLGEDEKRKREGNSNRHQKMGPWQCLNNLGKALISSGYGLALILVAGFVATAWSVFGGMGTADKKEALLAILGWPVFGLAGWVIAVVTIVVAQKILKFQARSYEGRITEIRKTKEEALSIQANLPFVEAAVAHPKKKL